MVIQNEVSGISLSFELASSPMTHILEHLSCTCLPSSYLLGKVSVKVVCPFFNRVICFLIVKLSSLYILVLCEIYLLQILSPRRQFVFLNLLTVSLCEQKFFILMKPVYQYFFHGSCLFYLESYQFQSHLSFLLSCKSFIVLSIVHLLPLLF